MQARLNHPGPRGVFLLRAPQEKRSGTFVCGGCGTPLFASETKFESGEAAAALVSPLLFLSGCRFSNPQLPSAHALPSTSTVCGFALACLWPSCWAGLYHTFRPFTA